MTLEELNQLSLAQAEAWFMQTCAAQSWYQQMQKARPYSSLTALQDKASSIWQNLSEHDYLQAFEAHPMIGDVDSLKAKYASTKAVASNEQSGTAEASEATLQNLHQLNRDYLDKNGFIFIICATGLSAESMLKALQSRIHNTRETEIKMAAAEQIKITQLRIQKGLSYQQGTA